MSEEKYIDESWKDRASNEKDASASQKPEGSGASEEFMEVNFVNYITSLAFQAMIFLGEVPSPITDKIEKNLKQAKFIIDTLALLKEKTNGNLNQQENDILNMSLYELQMRYVDTAEKRQE